MLNNLQIYKSHWVNITFTKNTHAMENTWFNPIRSGLFQTVNDQGGGGL